VSIVTKEFYAIACDGCGYIDDAGEFSYWAEEEFAYIMVDELDWKRFQFGDRDLIFCEGHMEWSCDTEKPCASCGKSGDETEQLWADNCEECWMKAVRVWYV
jgi:hypothetical protein